MNESSFCSTFASAFGDVSGQDFVLLMCVQLYLIDVFIFPDVGAHTGGDRSLFLSYYLPMSLPPLPLSKKINKNISLGEELFLKAKYSSVSELQGSSVRTQE